MADSLAEARAHHEAGRLAEADAGYAAALAADPGNAEAWHLRGLAAHRAGRPTDAEAHVRRALEIRPDFPEARNSLGGLLLAAGRAEAALAAFEAALAGAPGLLEARYNRAKALRALGRFEPAAAAFREVLDRRPGHVGALCDLAALLLRRGRGEEAAGLLRAGRAAQPAAPKLLINLALVLEALNDLDAAAAAAREAADLGAGGPALALVQARLAERRGDLTGAEARLARLARAKLAGMERAEVLFALGRLRDGLGRPEAAFAAFAEANALQAAGASGPWDGARFLRQVALNRNWFTAARLRRLTADPPAPAAAPPVFFVGFPRSGTTLVERALAAHPGAVSTEERSPLVDVLRELRRAGRYPQLLEAWQADDRAAARAGFWRAAEEIVGPLEGRRLIDKLPLNLVELGLANVLFPEARVVVALRDPRDVCLSCFMQHFQLNDSMVHFLDLARTVRCYGAVMDLWLAYRAALTLAWRELRYEELVADFEGGLKGLLEFLDLPWDEAVLGYRAGLAGRAVTTPSYRQVAAPLTDRAVGRWRRYRDALAPVLPALALYVEAFGYDPS